METMSLTTPALLFPAISLLLLAYTNRFLTLAQVIRQMHPARAGAVTESVTRQIASLRHRVSLIKSMQSFGVLSFLLCALSMFALFIDYPFAGKLLFGASIVALALSLVISLAEIMVSTHSLEIVLADIAASRAGRGESDAEDEMPHMP